MWISWDGTLHAGYGAYSAGGTASTATTSLSPKYLAVRTENECAAIDASKFCHLKLNGFCFMFDLEGLCIPSLKRSGFVSMTSDQGRTFLKCLS